VLGRRGISGIKEFFLGSISQKVINTVKDVSVVFVN
jgi:nucleotide-binding universal stress UspA family protein